MDLFFHFVAAVVLAVFLVWIESLRQQKADLEIRNRWLSRELWREQSQHYFGK